MKTINKKYSQLAFLGLILFIFFQNCSQQGAINVSGFKNADIPIESPLVDSVPIENPQLKFEVTDGSDYVCSSLGSVLVPSEKSGLKCELRYIDTQSTMTNTEKINLLSVAYFDDTNSHVIKTPEVIYLNDVNTPTKQFEAGFKTAAGDTLKDDKGNALIEYFALKMETLIKLDTLDEEGEYLLATISDDGTIVQVKDKDVWETVVANDGPHAARMGCASKKITLNRNSKVPIRIFYNQGPRTQIANVLVWRKILPDEPEINYNKVCGQASSVEFWHPDTYVPGVLGKQILAENWKILKPQNYQLPDNEVNPCAFAVGDMIKTFVKQEPIAGSETQPIDSRVKNQSFHLVLNEPASLEVNIYSIGADQIKEKIGTISKEYAQDFNIELPVKLNNKNHIVEIIMSTQNNLKKIRKEFKLKTVE